MNKFITLLLISVINLSSFALADPLVNVRTAIVVDYHSDKILYEYEADIQIYPASMTKIMTTIIAFDLIKKNRLSLDDQFVVSENAWRLSESGYSSMFIMVNDEVSVENLLQGIIVASGNDACVALAEGIAGSEEAFAEMMNETNQETLKRIFRANIQHANQQPKVAKPISKNLKMEHEETSNLGFIQPPQGMNQSSQQQVAVSGAQNRQPITTE